MVLNRVDLPLRVGFPPAVNTDEGTDRAALYAETGIKNRGMAVVISDSGVIDNQLWFTELITH